MMRRLLSALTRNRFARSILRHGFPDSNRNRALTIFSNFFLHIHPVKVRLRAIAFRRTFYLGGLAAATLFILTVTGVLLMFYYRPSVPEAYEDMKDLQFVVSAGVFLRNLHRWSAHAMVGLVFLHMIRVFFAGAYRPPREFNWVIGVVLFVLTLLMSFTGYLLPWDQLAYWAITVGTNMAKAVPFLGEKIRFLLLGGNDVGEPALLRFYVLHCVVLPLVLFMTLAVHIWRVRKDGGLWLPPRQDRRDVREPPAATAEASAAAADAFTPPLSPEYLAVSGTDARRDPVRLLVVQGEARPPVRVRDEPMVMTFPHLMIRELIALVSLSIGLVVISLLFDAPLEEMANPEKTPNPAKAPWYFLGLQELLHYYPPIVAGVLLPLLVVLGLAVIPYFDINLERRPLWERVRSGARSRSATLAGIWIAIAAGSALFLFTGAHPVWPVVIPLWAAGIAMSLPALDPAARSGILRWLAIRSISFWVFFFFLLAAVSLTVIGVFFRGPGWAFVLPWETGAVR